MSEQEIQQAIRDAHEYAGQDQTRKDAMEVLSDVQRLMSETEQKLKAQKKIFGSRHQKIRSRTT